MIFLLVLCPYQKPMEYPAVKRIGCSGEPIIFKAHPIPRISVTVPDKPNSHSLKHTFGLAG
ncbi:MAG: hypothetical protein ACR2HJ_08500 [Fimbriimonadales bacterium]